MGDNGEYPGVSPPLSTEPPKDIDLKLNESLMQELKSENNFPSQEENNRRTASLQKMQRLLMQLVQIVGKEKGLPESLLQEAGGRVFTFGSYRLGVYSPGSDVDTLLVAPKHVTRDDFFKHFPDLIRKSTPEDEIEQLVPVPGISVPIIKCELSGVDLDLLFCSLQLSSIPKNLELTDNNLLRGLDDTDLRCVNGTRVNDRILSLVPQTRTFRIALRAIKLWAKRRALYANVVGFPGGVAYALMVARVCQLYPKAAAPLIVQKFFFVMYKWQWPNAVILQKRETHSLNLREWDPQTYRGDKFHLMPVITPAYPCMNSTHNIGQSQKIVLLREFQRGEEIVTDIYSGKRQWKDLFVRHRFFSEAYKHYICVVTGGRTKQAQQAWCGLVQSKLRRLVQGIEQSDADSVELVQPYNKGFDRVHDCPSDEDVQKTLHGSLDFQVETTKTADQSADANVQAAGQATGEEMAEEAADVKPDGPQTIWTTTYYLGIGLKKGANNLDISYPVADFKRSCEEWDSYDNTIHSIQIKHIRNHQLPDDVFAEGEARPTKKTKKAGKPVPTADKKRSFTNAGLDEQSDAVKRHQSEVASGTPVAPTANGTATPNGSVG